MIPLAILLYLQISQSIPPELSTNYVQFIDATAGSGLDFRHVDGRSGQKYLLETLGSGAAFFDYDNDGFLDLYAVNGADLPGSTSESSPRNVLYHNNGNGTFSDVTQRAGVGDPSYGVGCVAADYDNDGFCDLYVTNFGPNVLYHNNGDGTFTDRTQQAGVGCDLWSSSAVFFDYDNDGLLDLYVVNYLEFDFETHEWWEIRGIPTYRSPPDQHPGVRFFGEPGILYHNIGDGTFADVTSEAGFSTPMPGLAVTVGDYDDDGDMDLYIANDMAQQYLYANNGDGTFTDQTFVAGVGYDEHGMVLSGMGADFGDCDNDGDLDLVVSNAQNQPAVLFQNEAGGFFSDVTYVSRVGEKTLLKFKWTVAFFDHDNDGFQDLFVSNGHLHSNIHLFYPSVSYPQPNQLFLNLANGRFEDISQHVGTGFQLEKVSRAATFGDYDNDGDVDIFINNSNQKADLLRNEGGNRRHWLTIQTVGTVSNRDGIGARITITTGSQSQIREIAGLSYLSQRDKRAHFGLGEHSKVARIEIRWPSGLIQRFENAAVDQFVTITEGRSTFETWKAGAR